MNELEQLQALGLVLPTPAYLAGALLFGLLGYITFRRGRKTGAATLTWSGLVLMLYPYAISSTWLLWTLGVGLCAWVAAKWT